MTGEWKWRGALIALVTLGAIYMLVPSYYYFKLPPDKRNDKAEFAKVLPSWAPDNRLNLGLDLQGGIHLVMEVDVDAGIAAKAANRSTEMQDYLTKQGTTGVTGKVINRNQVVLTVPAGKMDAVEKAANDYFNDMDRIASTGDTATFAFKPTVVSRLKDDAVEQSIRAIRNRVDKFGVTEPTINRHGANHILVQLPGFANPEQARELIGKTAQLEF
ncbi:MAG: protein translocase subunit SecD, partial [Fimbriimonadales bacterium]